MSTLSSRRVVWTIFIILFYNSISAQDQYDYGFPETNINLISLENNEAFGSINKSNVEIILKATPSKLHTTLLNRTNERIAVELSISNSNYSDKRSSVYYTGKIKGNSASLVMVTIKNNNINCSISDNLGNYNFSSSSKGYVISENNKTKNARIWSCHEPPEKNEPGSVESPNTKSQITPSDTIEIYFVCDYELFVLHNFSVEILTDYVHDLFFQVQTLYEIEEIFLKLGEIKIWETPDPYGDESPASSLLNFRSDLDNDYPGTLAHLLSGNANLEGGTAFINGLCDRNKSYGYSNVEGLINDIGVYSWDVHVVAHELGHNLGSQHTHACAWGPDGTDAIDSCGEPAPACDNAPIPTEGGTIMSYCHTTNVGVNFSLGFGTEPAERMKEIINQCHADSGESCVTAETILENETYFVENLNSGNGSHHADATHSKWYMYQAIENGMIDINSCGQEVDTRMFLYNGNCTSLNQIAISDDDCLSGNGYNYASIINTWPIAEGDIIYIEWDDRWSSDSFTFTFNFTSEIDSMCSNGIMDGTETDIDCGGDCQPCLVECNDDTPMPQLIDTVTLYRSQNIVNYNGQIITPGALHITSQIGVDILPGFEIAMNAQLAISIDNCN